ncbi:Asp23/Gls24 family envelope stress response protein [Anaerobacillus isosaccharinicus]|uniref:Asp23/Gls24 family envelope stress response protein n=1 Tax=Anaerobacillus isosaccharinicus TaxID=1532552 RepID=A0A1S2MFB7_9BACI|nr:Asp23/Gls24 family envelope stress response protein [Anaerobacillus isosaccharinicus]MBA5585621.1 Asp23/Gls24 family envelope stress response protein [Anaerobacillus isosaccharinicus]QOY36069.1 Asp23/Gls24 family envelope stress response protein [Anaerobacillus isosaccharinicus]
MTEENHVIDMEEQHTKLGKVEISPEVIEVITSIAAAEVEGVATMRGNFATGVAEKLGRKNHGKGVKVDLGQDGISVDVYIIMNYGVSIPDVAKKVQDNIHQTLRTMTAIDLIAVNVHVVGIQLETQQVVVDNTQE